VVEQEEKATDNKNEIWDADEVRDIPYLKKDQRQTPEFEVNFLN